MGRNGTTPGADIPGPESAEEVLVVGDRIHSKQPSNRCLTSRDRSFLDRNYLPAFMMGRVNDVDASLLLGLSAYESAWGTSNAGAQRNNPFGATPGGDATRGITYGSVEHAWARAAVRNAAQEWLA